MADEWDRVSFHSFLVNNPFPEMLLSAHMVGIRIGKAFAHIIFLHNFLLLNFMSVSCWLVTVENAEG